MTNPTPTPLTDDQVAAIRARLEAIYVPTDRAKQRAVDFLAHAPGDIASLLADRTALTRRVEELTAAFINLRAESVCEDIEHLLARAERYGFDANRIARLRHFAASLLQLITPS